jgi:ketosteroid isomerase-like protein
MRHALATLALFAACTDPSTVLTPAQSAQYSVGEGAEASTNARLNLREERAALLAADQRHAAASVGGLLSGFPLALASDVVFLYSGARVIEGRDATVAFLRTLPGADTQTLAWTPVSVDVSADATRGYSYGNGTRVVNGVTSRIQYLAYWRREPDGEWRTAAWLLRGALDVEPRALPELCAAPTTPHERFFPRTTEAGEEAALLLTDAEFSDLSDRVGGGEAFATYVAENGVLLLGDASGVACGRAEMRAANESLAPGVLTWVPRIADAAPSGDLGMTIGIGAFRDGSQIYYSKYLTIWKKQRNGAWRFVVDAGNSTPAP